MLPEVTKMGDVPSKPPPIGRTVSLYASLELFATTGCKRRAAQSDSGTAGCLEALRAYILSRTDYETLGVSAEPYLVPFQPSIGPPAEVFPTPGDLFLS
jgi:hypothetical protein